MSEQEAESASQAEILTQYTFGHLDLKDSDGISGTKNIRLKLGLGLPYPVYLFQVVNASEQFVDHILEALGENPPGLEIDFPFQG